jgi:uncharacterized protein YndB with AHSA1/START domain
MTKNTIDEKERMVVSRVFDAPRALVWKAWTDPQIYDAVVGAEWFYCAFFARWIFAWEENFSGP